MRTHLVALVAAALLPALAVGAIAVAAAVDNHRRAFEDRLEGTAAALASAVGAEIGSTVAALSTLATADGLDGSGDLAAFHERARRAAAALGTRVFLVARDGTLLVHTMFPPGTDFGDQRQRRSLAVSRAVFETGRPAVGDLIAGQVTTERPIVAVYVPVARDGEVAYALGAALEPERISRLLREQGFRGGGHAGVVDGSGNIVASSTDPERFVGQRVGGWAAGGVAEGGPSGVPRGANLDGAEIATAFRRVPNAPGWVVTVAEPRSAFHASLWPPLATLALGCLGSGAAALLAAMRIGKRVLRPVRSLTRRAEAVAASGGDPSLEPDEPARVGEFARLQRAVGLAEEALRERAAAVAAGEARLRAVVDTATDAIVVVDERGVIQSFNRGAEAVFGRAAAEAVGRDVSLLVGGEHAAKHGGYIAAYRRTGVRKAVGHLRDMEGRRKDGSPVPLDISLAEWRDGEGRRFFTAIMRDVSERKADEARRALLAREVDHRAKNALAVVQSVLRLTPRGEPAAFAAAVEARVAALARVHSLLAEGGWSGADLRAVAERELAPYAAPRRGGCAGGAEEQGPLVSLDGPPVPLAPAAAQPFAMVLHELATNAAKHGALSAPGGRVELRWGAAGRRAGDGGMLRLRWAEAGGPRVAGPPGRRGFGSRVVEATVRGQLGGTVDRHWDAAGLVVEIAVPLRRAVRRDAGGPPGGAEAAVPSAA